MRSPSKRFHILCYTDLALKGCVFMWKILGFIVIVAFGGGYYMLSQKQVCIDEQKEPQKMELKIVDTLEGTGRAVEKGNTLRVHYRGTLENGQQFDSSFDRGEPLQFKVGVGQVIKGWDDGLLGMKVGGKRTIHIPSELGYGARGAGGVIPPNSNLVFDVELVEIL